MSNLDIESFKERAKIAHEELMEYARRATKIFGPQICTYNLHTLACRGYRQELARGPMSRDKEFWLERKIQELKQRVKYRAKSNAEAVLVNDLMVSLAIERLRARDSRLRSFDELLDNCTPTTKKGRSLSCCPLFDMLPSLSKVVWFDLRRHLATIWEQYYRNDDSGWSYEDIIAAEVEQYKRCILERNEKKIAFHSESYRRSTSSVSFYVHLVYNFNGNICQYIAKIKKFLLLKAPSFATALQDLPLALVDLHEANCTKDGNYTLTRLLEVVNLEEPQFIDYPVKVEDLIETVIPCIPGNSSHGFFILDDPNEDV